MKYNDLEIKKVKQAKRVGRGISAGGGKTAGRGTKGQNARSGKKHHASFEGGQSTWIQKVPKNKGFKSKRLRPQVVFSDQLNQFSGVVDNFTLMEADLIVNPYNNVKVVQRGEFSKKIDLRIQKVTKGTLEQIEKAGGKFTQTALTQKGKKPSNKTGQVPGAKKEAAKA